MPFLGDRTRDYRFDLMSKLLDEERLHRPLSHGELYSAEPGLYVYGLGGFCKDDTVVVGTAPEALTKSPGDLASQTIL